MNARDVHEGRAHRACKGCGDWHGSVQAERLCLEDAIDRERAHPDRLRGAAAREAFEQWQVRR